MSAAKYTPGPWKVLPPEDGVPYLRIRGTALGLRFKVANVLHAIRREGQAEYPVEAEITEANARLIAAAPELLQTLVAAEHALRSFQYGNASEEFAEAQANICAAAIAKAAGSAS